MSNVLNCEWCGDEFERSSRRGPRPKFCSVSHRQQAYRARQLARFAEEVGAGSARDRALAAQNFLKGLQAKPLMPDVAALLKGLDSRALMPDVAGVLKGFDSTVLAPGFGAALAGMNPETLMPALGAALRGFDSTVLASGFGAALAGMNPETLMPALRAALAVIDHGAWALNEPVLAEDEAVSPPDTGQRQVTALVATVVALTVLLATKDRIEADLTAVLQSVMTQSMMILRIAGELNDASLEFRGLQALVFVGTIVFAVAKALSPGGPDEPPSDPSSPEPTTE